MSLDYLPHILSGVGLTLQVALCSLAIATVLGLLGALFRLSKFKPLALAAEAYATCIRGTPDLVLMLLVFYGGQIGLNNLMEHFGFETIDINQFVAGVSTLGFIYGAYLSETFRGAILDVPKGQAEAGYAFGMGHLQVFFRIVLPQVIRLAIPGFTNNWLVMVKSTALVSVIGLQDMMYRAKEAGSATREPFTYLVIVGMIYLVITSISLQLLKIAEKRYSVGVRKGEF